MIIRELVTRLGFSADNSGADRHESALARVRSTALKLTAAYSATIGAAGALAIKMAGTTNTVAKSAAEAGLAGDEYQRLSFALGQVSQVSEGEADRALGRLNQRIGRARREGGKYAEALVDMGFSQQQVADGSITTSQAMDALTRRLGNAADAQEAAAIAGDILGTRIGRRLGPALHANAQAFREQQERADELGGGWSKLALTSGEALTDTVAEVGIISTSLTSVLAEKLIPATNRVISGFVDWFTANRELILQNMRHYLDVLTSAVSAVSRVLITAGKAVDTVVQRMGGWERVLGILAAAVTGFMALKIGSFVWGLVSALTAAGGATRALRWAMLALSRLPIIAAMIGIGLAIEDLIVWINGGDSAIGRWLGSWDDFKVKALAVLSDVIDYIQPLIDQIKAIGKIIEGVFTLDAALLMEGFTELGAAVAAWATTLFDSVAGFLRSALTPDIDAIMASMAALGDRMLGWAAGIGRGLVDKIVGVMPDWMKDAFGIGDQPAAPEPAPNTVSGPAAALTPPPGGFPASGGTDNRDQSVNTNASDASTTHNDNRDQRDYRDQRVTEVREASAQAANNINATLGYGSATPESVTRNINENRNTSQRSVTVNARIDSTLQVPEGTPEQQQAALRAEAERTFGELFDREINRTLVDMPEAQ